MKNLSIVVFRLVLATLCISAGGCGGSSPDATPNSQNTSSTPIANGGQDWPGRAWYVRNSMQLYSARYADAKPILVDNDLHPAENTNTPAVALSKNGQFYVTRASDRDVTESHFSVRMTENAKEIGYFWYSRHSGDASISNDGRYVAWVSSATHSDYLRGIYDLYLSDTRPNGVPGVKTIQIWKYGSAAVDPKVMGFDWTWDNRLLLFKSTGDVIAFSPTTNQYEKLGQIPEAFDGKKILVGSAVINRDMNKLAGKMLASPDSIEIWVSNIDGSNIHQNTAVGTVITNVDWAPSGDMLHGGDCRGVIYGTAPVIDTGGRYSWIVPSSVDRLSLLDSKKFTATFKDETYPHFLDCHFMWTE